MNCSSLLNPLAASASDVPDGRSGVTLASSAAFAVMRSASVGLVAVMSARASPAAVFADAFASGGRLEVVDGLSEAVVLGAGHFGLQVSERNPEVLRRVERRDELALVLESLGRVGQRRIRRATAASGCATSAVLAVRRSDERHRGFRGDRPRGAKRRANPLCGVEASCTFGTTCGP